MVASITKELYGMEKLPAIELHTYSKSLKKHLRMKKSLGRHSTPERDGRDR